MDKLTQEILSLSSVIRRIITDRGTEFTLKNLDDYYDEKGIEHVAIVTGFHVEMDKLNISIEISYRY